MNGRRLAASGIVAAIAATGMTTNAATGAPAKDKPGAGKHQQHKKKKAKRKQRAPKPSVLRQSVVVDAVGAGAMHLEFTASRAIDAPADQVTGHFKGSLAPTGTEFGSFSGPVTCLTVVGDDIGVFYPINESSPPGIEDLNAGVFVSVKTDGQGEATSVGFMPVPQKESKTCDPSMVPALLPAMGKAEIKTD